MAKYRKKTVEIEAVQWLGTAKSFEEIIDMGISDFSLVELGSESFYIKTLEGDHKVSLNDFIIKGVKGKFYLCKPDIFKLTYDEVN